MALSHTDRLLLILMRGGWVSTAQVLREHPMMVHSRVSDLRAKGHTILHRTVGKGAAGSEYRLALEPAAVEDGDTAYPSQAAAAGSSALTEEERTGQGGPVGGKAGRALSRSSSVSAPLNTGEPRRVASEGPSTSGARPLAPSPVLSGASAQAAPGLDRLPSGARVGDPLDADSPGQLSFLGGAA